MLRACSAFSSRQCSWYCLFGPPSTIGTPVVSVEKASDINDGEPVKQVLRMLCDSRPRQVAGLLVDDSNLLCRLFSGQPKRVLKWFKNFAVPGEVDHQLGARALARFVFMHRETFWHELVWQGDHSQAPATVASKPHYFSELDVLKTVDNFLENVPSFWYSQELKDSLRDGEFLTLDIDFFVSELFEKMVDDHFSSVWQVVATYLAEESFGLLCQRILPIVNNCQLLEFLNGMGEAIVKWKGSAFTDWKKREEEEGRYLVNSFKGRLWLDRALSAGVHWKTLNDAILCNACSSHGRELLRLFQDEEQQEEANLLDSLMLVRNAYDEKDHWDLREECLLSRKSDAVKWLSMEGWFLFYLLSQEDVTSLELLMTENGIGFLRADALSLDIQKDRDRMDKSTAKEERRSRKRDRMKLIMRSRKKLKHMEDDDLFSDDDHFRILDEFSRQSTVNWRLSLDNYVITWTKVDIVESLVNHALMHWLQWTISRW